MNDIASSHATYILTYQSGTHAGRFEKFVSCASRHLPPLDAAELKRATGGYTTVANDQSRMFTCFFIPA